MKTGISLDVEDDDARLQRLQILLERANNRSASQPPRTVPPCPASFDFGKRETHAVAPPTILLNRLQTFLPQLEASNAELARRAEADPASVDIENVDDSGSSQYIEMNLGLGVFDVRQSNAAHSRSESISGSEASDADTSTGSSSDPEGTSVDSDSVSDVNVQPFISSSLPRPTKPLPRRGKPSIVVLSETSSSTENAVEKQ